jgi:RNA polymerase sigma-70 factor (ECF subfamily)
MSGVSEPPTSITLLARLRRSPTDQVAWDRFVERYGPAIYRWCRHRGLQKTDAEDVTQDVLLRLLEKMRTFQYDAAGSFRGWLHTLTHHAWYDFLKKRQRCLCGAGEGSSVLPMLQTVEAREELIRHLEEEFDLELLDQAMAEVQRHVEPRTWAAFRLLAVEGHSGAEVAALLQMKVAAVFVARSRVQKMLRAEVQRLEEAHDTAEEEPS